DLISNDESRNTFKVRSQILSGIHHELANTREDLRAYFKGVTGFISNDESRNTFKVRSQILSGIRQFMADNREELRGLVKGGTG
ncbi:hypothetical protein PSZ80_24000, partial [Shigella sonnei]|nr:hypothetical protein [Shigella sonnei]